MNKYKCNTTFGFSGFGFGIWRNNRVFNTEIEAWTICVAFWTFYFYRSKQK